MLRPPVAVLLLLTVYRRGGSELLGVLSLRFCVYVALTRAKAISFPAGHRSPRRPRSSIHQISCCRLRGLVINRELPE
jgi:hypothetical protein